MFQSVFINYFELKRPEAPDYIATHAMAINAGTFRKSGGFPAEFLPCLRMWNSATDSTDQDAD